MSGNLLNTNIALLGLNNLADSTTWRSGPVATNPVNGQSLSASNLANRKLSNVWRSTGFTPDSCGFGGDITANNRTVGGVALVGHNLTGFTQILYNTPIPTGRWRFRGTNGAASSIIPRPRALAILASTNLTGTVSAIQDADTETWDSNWLTATSGSSNTSVRVSFQSPTGMNLDTSSTSHNTPGVLPMCQQFFVTLRRTSGGGGASPNVTFTLYENGTSRGTITGGGAVGSTTGATFVLNWSAASLSSNIDDGRVQLQIDGAAFGGNTVEIGAVSWAREFTTGGGYSYVDTGWLNVVLPTSFTNNPSIPGPPFTEVNFITPQNVDSFWVDVADPSSTYSYLQAGRLIVSSVDTFVVGLDWDWGLTWNDSSIGIRSTGSSSYVYRLQPWREFTGMINFGSQQEAYSIILDKLDRGRGTWGDFLCVINPDDQNFLWMRCLYCKQALLDGAQNSNAIVQQKEGNYYSRKLLFEEIS